MHFVHSRESLIWCRFRMEIWPLLQIHPHSTSSHNPFYIHLFLSSNWEKCICFDNRQQKTARRLSILLARIDSIFIFHLFLYWFLIYIYNRRPSRGSEKERRKVVRANREEKVKTALGILYFNHNPQKFVLYGWMAQFPRPSSSSLSSKFGLVGICFVVEQEQKQKEHGKYIYLTTRLELTRQDQTTTQTRSSKRSVTMRKCLIDLIGFFPPSRETLEAIFSIHYWKDDSMNCLRRNLDTGCDDN